MRALSAPDSTTQLVHQALLSGGRMSQAELATLTGRAVSSICKALKLLEKAGMARLASKTANRRGSGKPQSWYEPTGYRCDTGGAVVGAEGALDELEAVHRAWVAARGSEPLPGC